MLNVCLMGGCAFSFALKNQLMFAISRLFLTMHTLAYINNKNNLSTTERVVIHYKIKSSFETNLPKLFHKRYLPMQINLVSFFWDFQIFTVEIPGAILVQYTLMYRYCAMLSKATFEELSRKRSLQNISYLWQSAQLSVNHLNWTYI